MAHAAFPTIANEIEKRFDRPITSFGLGRCHSAQLAYERGLPRLYIPTTSLHSMEPFLTQTDSEAGSLIREPQDHSFRCLGWDTGFPKVRTSALVLERVISGFVAAKIGHIGAPVSRTRAIPDITSQQKPQQRPHTKSHLPSHQ